MQEAILSPYGLKFAQGIIHVISNCLPNKGKKKKLENLRRKWILLKLSGQMISKYKKPNDEFRPQTKSLWRQGGHKWSDSRWFRLLLCLLRPTL